MSDSLGFFTVVVSDAADRPINAVRTNDITWLPWGPYPDGLLLYRHLLPNPAFAQAIQNVPYGSDPDAVMGDYFPQVAYCTRATAERSEEHTSELQSLMRISYAVFCLKKKTTQHTESHIQSILQ